MLERERYVLGMATCLLQDFISGDCKSGYRCLLDACDCKERKAEEESRSRLAGGLQKAAVGVEEGSKAADEDDADSVSAESVLADEGNCSDGVGPDSGCAGCRCQ